MQYNTQQKRMPLPEYGRSIQNMVDYALTIQDRAERQRCANTIINIMGNMFPHLRDVPDFKHKLWDHLAIMSGFELDIDYPYEIIRKDNLVTRPDHIPYSTARMRYRHYGHTLEVLIKKAIEFPEGNEKRNLIALICNHMKKDYLAWNKDTVDDKKIAEDLYELSNGELQMTDDIVRLMAERLNQNYRPKTNYTNNRQNNKRRYSNTLYLILKKLMASFVIEGGHRLSGEIHPQGAKNEVLQIICATLLTAEEVTVNNIPDILDVNNLIQLLREMGVTVAKKGIDSYSFKAENVDLAYLESDEFLKKCSSLRGSVMLIGPMVARFGKALISKPGGDKIGRRRLDTHFVGIQNLGADFRYDEERGIYEITADRLQGSYMLLDEASVTGTANIVMAAVLAKGTTTIYNAACEPYVQQLCRLLNRMGAKISGIASNLLTIEGVEELHGTQHTVLPDMIEVGSFIGMAAMTKSEITIKNVSYENLGIIPESFRRLGIKLEQRGDDIYVPAQETYQIESFIDGSIMTIADATWPGLTPDLLSVMLVVATQAKGSVLIHQKMFESRLFFVDKLIDMGAQIILCDPHRAVVIGHNHGFKLRGARLTSPDIRAGIALLIAAMSAEGTSTISNIEQIDRGYQNIEGRLNAIGARITRI